MFDLAQQSCSAKIRLARCFLDSSSDLPMRLNELQCRPGARCFCAAESHELAKSFRFIQLSSPRSALFEIACSVWNRSILDLMAVARFVHSSPIECLPSSVCSMISGQSSASDTPDFISYECPLDRSSVMMTATPHFAHLASIWVHPIVRLPEQRIRESASLLLVNQRAPVPSWRSLSFVLPAKMREPRGWCGALSNRDQSDRLEFYTSPSWHPFASLRLRDSTHVWIAN